jgi:two-component system response regulator (stage 0 sporulation protein A)
MTTRPKVLISSDDRKDFYNKCSAFFGAYDYETVLVVKDGEEVCRAIREHQPDVVMMEVFMPGQDAISVMQDIREDRTCKTPLFMIVSTFDSGTLQRELMMNGASYFFLMPVDVETMVERVVQIAHSPAQEMNRAPSLPIASPLSTPDLQVMVTEVIHIIGVPAHIKGYHYLRDSIIFAIQEPDIINSVTKELYPSVAKKNSTTPSRVERAIRHAIEVAWDRGDVDTLNAYFGYTIHNGRGKPTNSEFIAMISDKLRLKLRVAV